MSDAREEGGSERGGRRRLRSLHFPDSIIDPNDVSLHAARDECGNQRLQPCFKVVEGIGASMTDRQAGAIQS